MFTGRYELSPYITTLCFAFKWLVIGDACLVHIDIGYLLVMANN